MIFNGMEEKTIVPMYRALENETGNLVFYWNDAIVVGKIITWYETDNELEEDEIGYEEYNVCSIQIVNIIQDRLNQFQKGAYYEAMYRNMPNQVKNLEGEVIFSLGNG